MYLLAIKNGSIIAQHDIGQAVADSYPDCEIVLWPNQLGADRSDPRDLVTLSEAKEIRKWQIDQEVIAANANGYTIPGQLDLIATGAYLTRKAQTQTLTPTEQATADYLAGFYETTAGVKAAGEAAKATVDACQTIAAVWLVQIEST